MKKKILFIGLILITSCGGSNQSYQNPKVDTVATVAPAEPAVEVVQHWEYSQEVDKMEGTKQFFAVCKSSNILDMAFPYNEGVVGYITIRNMGKGNEILLSLNQGQFMTNFDGTYLKMKFDDDKPFKALCNPATDPSLQYLFFENAGSIISKFKKSKKVMVEAEFFNEGRRIFEFDTEGLKWTH